MLNSPKNGLTYTQKDREKWQNTFTTLHVLVTEKVQHASTITLARRCSHASDSPGPAMVEFLSNPFIPCNLRPKYPKTGGVYPFMLNATGGGPPWAKAPSQGVRPFAVAQGAAFLGGWCHVVPNPQKSYLRLVWPQYVVGGGCGCTPPRKKNGGNGKTKFPTLLDRIFARPISPNRYAHPLFFLSLQSRHQIVPKMRKNPHFLDPPPRKKNFSGHAIIKITQEFSVFIS